MIEGRYRESQPNSQGILEIRASEWNAEAFLILLDIIHGHHREVPRQLNLEIIAQVGLLVDYHDSLEIVPLFFDSWCSRIDDWARYGGPFDPSPGDKAESFRSREITLLFIAWAFRDGSAFSNIGSRAISNTTGLIETNLPIPSQVLGMEYYLNSRSRNS
jgi:hypothetical protein